MAGLKDFYNVSGESLADRPSEQPGAAGRNSASAAQAAIDAGKEYDELLKNYKALNTLLQQAQAGSTEALVKILERFAVEPVPLEVTITQPLLNSKGEEPENFGMKLINSQEEWASITRDYQTALMYFPGIELKSVPTNQYGKRLAVVMGVTAREFNAVITAERRRGRLMGEMQRIDAEREKSRKSMGVGNVARMPADDERVAAAKTPAQAKAEARGKTLVDS